MEKSYTKSKIIILSIAILLTILSLSIGIFGVINSNENDNQGESAVTHSGNFTFTYGGVTTTMYYEYDPTLGRGDEQFYKVYSNSSKSVFEFHHSYTGGNRSNTVNIYTVNGLRVLGYIIAGGKFPNGSAPTIGVQETTVYLQKNITIGTNGWEAMTKKFYKFDYNGFTITNNSGSPIFIDLVISTPQELIDFANNINSGVTYTGVKLGDNIDMKDQSMSAIGNAKYPFKGFFDGNGKTISNLPVLTADMSMYNSSGEPIYSMRGYGLFGAISGATICNLQISAANWSMKQVDYEIYTRVGLIASSVDGGTNNIYNCLILDSSIHFTGNNGFRKVYMGSIVGYVEGEATLNIKNVGAFCNINCIDRNGGYIVGGLVGICWSYNNLNIDNSYYYGYIKIGSGYHTGNTIMGGILGFFGAVQDSFDGSMQPHIYKYEGGSVKINNCCAHITALTINISDDSLFRGTLDVITRWCTSYSNNKYYIGSKSISGEYWQYLGNDNTVPTVTINYASEGKLK